MIGLVDICVFLGQNLSMKTKIIFALLIASAALSCGSPKVVAMQPSDPVVPQMPSPEKSASAERIAQGKGLYDERCANCHKLFSPADFTQTEWAPILTRMQKKARLDDEQMSLVREYVYSLAPM
jgi:mono/diheme cytochrome c family protein